jgi:uncharacterized protein (DUF58 family)
VFSPTGKLLILVWGPAALALASTIYPFLRPISLVADLVLLGVVLLDLVTLPRRRRVRVERSGPSVLSVGASNPFKLTVQNLGRRPLFVHLTESFPGTMEIAELPAAGWVGARGKRVFRYDVVPKRRGAFEAGRTYLRVTSLLGLWRRTLKLTLPHPMRVYPDVKILNTYALLAKRNRIDLLGFRKTRGRGSDVEFDRLRDYQPDDDYRRIDPFASARHRKLITREYEVSRNQNIFFMIDTSRLMAAESRGLSNLDHALNATLMLSSLALDFGDNVGLMAFDEQVRTFLPLSSGLRSKALVLHALYDLHTSQAEADFEQAFLALNLRVRQRALVVLLTNVMDGASFELLRPHLKIITRRHLPLVLLLRDQDLFELAERSPDSVPEFFEVGAAAELAGWREQLAHELARLGALVLDITPGQATPDLINSYLRIKADQLL